MGMLNLAEDMRITLEKLKETRTIKVRGKNVDSVDLEKLGKLIQEAEEKRPRTRFERFFGTR
jgi:hypothetical protein